MKYTYTFTTPQRQVPILLALPYSIIDNPRSQIYHRPDCPNFSQVAPHNPVEFNSAAEAAGYRVVGNCR